MNRKYSVVLFLFISICFLFTSSCSNLQYNKTLRYWSRQKDLYSLDTFAARILWHSTYLSPEFRATARAKVSEWKKLEPGEMGIYASYLMSNEPGNFIVSIYTPRAYPAITQSADNFWEFTLDLPTGESLMPTSIESVKVTPREQRLFPYANRWSKFYLVRFPVSNLTMPFTLTLRSAAATSFLDW